LVVSDLERDHGGDVECNPLPGDTLLGDFGLVHRERQKAGFAEERRDERAVTRDDFEGAAVLCPPRA
jgi:hypothetical protein